MKRITRVGITVPLRLVGLLVLGLLTLPAFAATVSRVSVASDGTQGNGHSARPAISADGRYVAFCSYASNLVPNDTNDKPDVFVHDLLTGQTERVSVASDGTQGNGYSGIYDYLVISADGRFVAFTSDSTNLVPGDFNGQIDVFVHDRQTGTMERVSVSSSGVEGNAASSYSSLSADGRYVAFGSGASNLVSQDTNQTGDAFVRDRQTGQTTCVSVDGQTPRGGSRPLISADGRYVCFGGLNVLPNTHGTYLRDRQLNVTTYVTERSPQCITPDARYVVTIEYNNWNTIFCFDRQAGSTSEVSINNDGTSANGQSDTPTINDDGRFIAFNSLATNLVANDANGKWDVFLRDRVAGTTTCVSVGNDGTPVGDSSEPRLSASGRYIAFSSTASNILANDTNGVRDVYVYDRGAIIASQPDLQVRAAGATEYIGTHLYNLLPEQTVAHTAQPGEAITYEVLVGNLGTEPLTFTLTGDGGDAGWTVRYFDAYSGGDEQTGPVTGDGWTVGPLAVGATREVRIVVTPGPTVPGGATFPVCLTAVSPADPAMTDTISVVTTKAPLTVSLEANPPSPSLLTGTPITLTANSNGVHNMHYRFFVSDGIGPWISLQGYGSGQTCPWTPASAGSYTLLVWAREIGSLNGKDAYTTLRYTVGAPLTAVALSADPPAPRIAGTPITLLATPTGGNDVRYRFFVYQNSAWVTLQGYGAANTCPYTPATPGLYRFLVWAREMGSTRTQDAYRTLDYTVTGGAPLTGVTLTADPPFGLYLGNTVTLTATPAGGSQVEYRFFVYTTGVWHELRRYGTDPTCPWTPITVDHNCMLLVWAREVGHVNTKDVYVTLPYIVAQP